MDVARCGWGLLVLIVVVVGACGSRSTSPAAGGTVVTISLVHGGARAAELENEAVEPIERAVASLAGVRSVRSTIEPGRARVVLSFEASRSAELAAAEVRRAIREMQRQLPVDLDPPVISLVDPDGPALWFELSGARPRAMLSDLARDVIEPRLERLPGVGAVELDGAVEPEIAIRPDLARLAASGIALTELAASIRSSSIDLPAGRLDATTATTATTTTIRVAAARGTIEGLGELVVATRAGATVRLRDVAVIDEDTAGDPGGPLRIGARIRQGADREAVFASVRSAIAGLRGELPPELVLVESRPPPSARAPAPLSVGVHGPDRAMLHAIAAKLESDLRASNVVSEIMRDPPLGRPEQTIDIDRDRAARLGISNAEVVAAARAALGTYPLGTLRSGEREREIVLRVNGSVPEIVEAVTVRASRGELVSLSTITTITTTASGHLLRLDREPAIELSVHVDPGPSLAAARRRLVELARDLPPGYRATISP